MPEEKTVTMEFDIEPTQGAVAMFATCALAGYEIVSIEREGRKVICEYAKI